MFVIEVLSSRQVIAILTSRLSLQVENGLGSEEARDVGRAHPGGEIVEC